MCTQIHTVCTLSWHQTDTVTYSRSSYSQVHWECGSYGWTNIQVTWYSYWAAGYHPNDRMDFPVFFFFIIVPKRCADYLKACWTWLVWPSLAQRLEADGNPDPKLSQSVRCIYQNARHYLERNSLTFFWNAVILFLKKFTWGLMSLWCLNNIFSSKWKVKLNTPTSHTRMT